MYKTHEFGSVSTVKWQAVCAIGLFLYNSQLGLFLFSFRSFSLENKGNLNRDYKWLGHREGGTWGLGVDIIIIKKKLCKFTNVFLYLFVLFKESLLELSGKTDAINSTQCSDQIERLLEAYSILVEHGQGSKIPHPEQVSKVSLSHSNRYPSSQNFTKSPLNSILFFPRHWQYCYKFPTLHHLVVTDFSVLSLPYFSMRMYLCQCLRLKRQ